ncbi:MAG: hypothetical protein U9R69_05080 [Thermodesulfobacteriota bacterium]|nr:hypothetical protein [Thermodesulfobacteriota bacterium]
MTLFPVTLFPGGAKVALIELNKGTTPDPNERGEIVSLLEVDGIPYQFNAYRKELAFTSTEKSFIDELLTAFQGLFAGFSAADYAAHFRTALLTSLADIAVARYIRGDRKGVFCPVQSLIQLLKNLSYQRYEGAPATTGFLIYRNKLDDFLATLEKTRYNWLDLGEDRRRITGDFFVIHSPIVLLMASEHCLLVTFR